MEILGFKSFAERSRIEFTPGITALLGPNGCGKSNVVDAIKWVLGEQASKSLRAEKMEDVIFNGTEHKKALGVAEVTLTISNEKNLLALDVPEIAIKRRLYRSGESEYFINNVASKLKEVRELFYDTGVGKSAYSVMEQGRIDQILSTKPEERRYLFEEAAGITKYKIRGQEAERRLEKTEENIRQIEGILGEVKRSYETLKKQSEKTLTYRSLRKEIFEYEKNIQLHKLSNLRSDKAKLTLSIEAQNKKRAEVQSAIDALNATLESNLDEVNKMEGNLIDLQKKLYGFDLEKNAFDSQLKMHLERRGQIQNQISLQESRALTLQDKKHQLIADIEAKISERESLQTQLKDCLKNIEDFEKNIETARLQIHSNSEYVGVVEDRVAGLESQEQHLQTELRGVTDSLVEQLDSKLKEQGFSWSQLPELRSRIEAGFKTLSIQLQGKNDLLRSIAQTKSFPEKDPFQFVLQFVEQVEEIQAELVQLDSNYQTFQSAVPNFLQDFLSPEGIITQKRAIEDQLSKNLEEKKSLRLRQKELLEENALLNEKIETYRKNLEELKINHVRMKTQHAQTELDVARLNKDSSEQDVHIQENQKEKENNEKRALELTAEIALIQEKIQQALERETKLKEETQALEKTIRERNESLIGKEKELKTGMDSLNSLQLEMEKLQIQNAQIEAEIRGLFDHFRDKHSVELNESETGEHEASTKDVRELLNQKKEELKNLGQVNLMAVEEFAEVEQRFEFLTKQLADLKKAREDLHQVTKEIQKESSELFLAAFQEIKINFNTVFRRLFGGGRAELKLTDLQNVLESGIEMLCQPPGKKLENINLLSGGEKSMTAVALLFATFMVRPSPFCILDEIDAALDESNVGRFVNMLVEFGQHSQFVVITHNKKTVTGASTMIGVTMEEPGISKIISIRLANPSEASA